MNLKADKLNKEWKRAVYESTGLACRREYAHKFFRMFLWDWHRKVGSKAITNKGWIGSQSENF